MLMDLTRMRRERTLQAAHAAQTSPASARFRFGDQCVLNLALAGRKGNLDPRWDIHTARLPLAAFHYLFVSGTRGIFHFCGLEKPWMAGAHPSLQALWAKYLSLTDYTLEEVLRPSRPGNLELEQILAEQRAAYFRQRT
jgi:lipopolysaccharide biosynthesis glycosyltransferase